jgi:AraC-like DNA-binding protein
MYISCVDKTLPRPPERLIPRHTDVTPLGAVLQGREARKDLPERWPRPRTLGQYALVYVTQGSGWYEQPQMRTAVGAGDLLVLFPDVPHAYNPDPAGWTEFYLVFNGPVFELWDRTGLLDRQQPVVHLDPIDSWRDRLWSVLGENALEEIHRLQGVLTEIQLRQRPRNERWRRQVEQLLERFGENPPNIAELAGALNMSESTLYRRFVKTFGMSPSRYLAAHLIDRACRLIVEQDLSNTELADRLGFADAFHFSKRFKQVAGQTPTQFRRSLSR